MSQYTPWMITYFDRLQYNTAVVNWLAQQAVIQYHANSDRLLPTLVCYSIALIQLLDHANHLMCFLGKQYCDINYNN